MATESEEKLKRNPTILDMSIRETEERVERLKFIKEILETAD